jgi:hypothetical protein
VQGRTVYSASDGRQETWCVEREEWRWCGPVGLDPLQASQRRSEQAATAPTWMLADRRVQRFSSRAPTRPVTRRNAARRLVQWRWAADALGIIGRLEDARGCNLVDLIPHLEFVVQPDVEILDALNLMDGDVIKRKCGVHGMDHSDVAPDAERHKFRLVSVQLEPSRP